MADPSGGVWTWIGDNYESLLVVGAVVGLGLATWRAAVANRQAEAAQEAAEAALQQVELSRESFVGRQFQAGVELFGNENLTIRLGGIFALTNMMQRYPDAYHTSVMRLFVAFLANQPTPREHEGFVECYGPDIHEIVSIINQTGEEQRELERLDHFDLEKHLEGTHFPLSEGTVVYSVPVDPENLPPDAYFQR